MINNETSQFIEKLPKLRYVIVPFITLLTLYIISWSKVSNNLDNSKKMLLTTVR